MLEEPQSEATAEAINYNHRDLRRHTRVRWGVAVTTYLSAGLLIILQCFDAFHDPGGEWGSVFKLMGIVFFGGPALILLAIGAWVSPGPRKVMQIGFVLVMRLEEAKFMRLEDDEFGSWNYGVWALAGIIALRWA